jgi:beta-glucosidase
LGKYPDSMRKQLGDRLPEFTAEEIALVKGSNDFYGMNHYCANYIRHKETEPEPEDFAGNLDALYQNKKGEWIGPETQSFWLHPNPLGFRKLIKWLSDRYGGPTFYVTENGTSVKGENDLPLEQLLDDEFRCEYFRGYIGALADAHTIDGVDVRGYSAWSLMEYVNISLPSLPPGRDLRLELFRQGYVPALGECRACSRSQAIRQLSLASASGQR